MGEWCISPLSRPIYVIRMGWHRWGNQARKRWLRELREACVTSIDRIDKELERMEMYE